MNYDDLEKLNNLRQSGAITEEEFQKEKEKILNGTHPFSTMTKSEENLYAMFIHLSQLISSFLLPLVLWLIKKDSSKFIDQTGKIVLNWSISLAIYATISSILCFVFIGIPILIALGICNFIFALLGATKANERVLWKYPLSIEFFKINE